MQLGKINHFIIKVGTIVFSLIFQFLFVLKSTVKSKKKTQFFSRLNFEKLFQPIFLKPIQNQVHPSKATNISSCFSYYSQNLKKVIHHNIVCIFLHITTTDSNIPLRQDPKMFIVPARIKETKIQKN